MSAAAEMPQKARWGECAYCLQSVPDDRLPKLPRSRSKRAATIRAAAVSCARCERVLAAGGTPPHAARCGECKGAGHVACYECGGRAERFGDPCEVCCGHKKHHAGTGRVVCGECGGRGMVVSEGNER